MCEPGYIQSPGRGSSTCGEGGEWSGPLECEVPLLLVHGGTAGPHSQPEVLAFQAMTEVDIGPIATMVNPSVTAGLQ